MNNHIEMGKHSYFSSEPNIQWADNGSKLIIGKFCSVAPGFTAYLGGNHYTNRISAYPFEHLLLHSSEGLTSESKGDIVIGNDVWIGDYVILMSGCSIGDGCFIGAHSVVRGNIPSYSVAYGNPCKVNHVRFSAEDLVLLKDMKWWNWEEALIREAYPFIVNKDVRGLYNFYLRRIRNVLAPE